MTLETDLRAALIADGDFSTLVGSRVYPDIAPQEASRPYVVYQRVSARRPYANDGSRNLAQPRIVYTVEANSRDIARQIVARIVAVGETWQGTTVGSSKIRRTEIDDETDTVERPVGGDEEAVYEALIDVLVWIDTS